ncbi:GDSL-type esterase/lipase family protein [Terriglobus saanensis]|uniref:Curculin domain protein (Mannose-binding) lectin n=1 Tax=Terriglobus saanensis (strain ATCC BAA-1853 / DSM 23119 / SP1PR4) TaxID=401053 RepID=E8V4R4_TERSS|nr:GDSL-type esterase/lipase family protein [Terriglobus saanensis]ADV81468.1 Curculin domain protein (mannose-binding) lectin [Terriglobus saanensis SP1PR4]
MRAIKYLSPSLRVLAAAIAFCGIPSCSYAQTSIPWTVTYSNALEDNGPLTSDFDNFNQQTLRQLFRTNIGGTAVRVELSNLFGSQPFVVADVHVAIGILNADGSPSSSTVPGTDHTLTFSGASTVTIPAGQSVLSDGVAFNLPANAEVMTSIYFPQGIPAGIDLAFNNDGRGPLLFLAHGDVSADTSISPYFQSTNPFILTSIQVQNAQSLGTVVAFGASITAGDQATYDHGWVLDLAQRLSAAGLPVGLANKGISGNGVIGGAGPQAGDRFMRDVLQVPNAKAVIFSDDIINSLGGPNPPTFDAIIATVTPLIQQAHAKGLKFWCSTLTPNGGRPATDWTPAAEAVREQVNAFYLNPANGCDAIIDQAKATQDPAMPLRYFPAFDFGDHLHPNDAGHVAIANAVNLGLFTPTGVPPITPPSTCGKFLSGEGMIHDQPLFSCNGQNELYFQGDSNLILYNNNTEVFSTRTEGHNPGVATLLADGNFVVTDAAGKILFSTNTAGGAAGGQALVVEDDGNLNLYSNAAGTGTPIWSSNTGASAKAPRKLLTY